jgi:hypothetical protein
MPTGRRRLASSLRTAEPSSPNEAKALSNNPADNSSSLIIESSDPLSGPFIRSASHPNVIVTWQGGAATSEGNALGSLLPVSAGYGVQDTPWPAFLQPCRAVEHVTVTTLLTRRSGPALVRRLIALQRTTYRVSSRRSAPSALRLQRPATGCEPLLAVFCRTTAMCYSSSESYPHVGELPGMSASAR